MYFRFLLTLSLFCASFVYSAHHETSEKAGYSEQEIIDIAMSAAPSNVSSEATIIDSAGKVLREGSMTGPVCQARRPMRTLIPCVWTKPGKNGCKPLWHKLRITQKMKLLERLIC